MTSVEVKVNRPSGTIALNRPEKRNALSREMLEELRVALDDLHQETRVRAVILTGNQEAFCAGLDLHEMHETSKDDDALRQWHDDVVLFKDIIETLLRFPKPIIAAINGNVAGGGLALALACDVIVAAENANVSIPEPKRGIVSGITAPLLCFRVGAGPAGYLLLTAKSTDAVEAQRFGIVHEVVANDLVWARAHQIAEEIASAAPEAIQLTKRTMQETVGEQLMTFLKIGAAASATSRTTEAAREGIAAFVERRSPEWP